MKLSQTLVAVKKLTCSISRSQFSEADLEDVAKVILKIGGIINPPIVRRTGLDTYEVIEGGFEYYAAVKAREINPMKGELIGTFVLDEENEAALLKQIQLLRQPTETTPTPPVPTSTATTATATLTPDLQKLILQLETSLEAKLEQLLQSKFTVLSTQIEQLQQSLQPISLPPGQPAQRPAAQLVADNGDYARKSAVELKAIAKQRGLKNYSKLTKNALIQLLSS